MKTTLFLFLLAAIPMLTTITCFAEDVPVPVDDKDYVPPQATISRDGIYLPAALPAGRCRKRCWPIPAPQLRVRMRRQRRQTARRTP